MDEDAPLSQPFASNAALLSDADIITATRRWIERAVIGLNLCPFARAPFAQQRVRLQVSHARDAGALVADLRNEAARLVATDPALIETTLLMHPFVFGDFADYNDFLEVADALLDEMQLDGVLQIASFHPDYRFADAAADEVGNRPGRRCTCCANPASWRRSKRASIPTRSGGAMSKPCAPSATSVGARCGATMNPFSQRRHSFALRGKRLGFA
jgi:hypothetical protein